MIKLYTNLKNILVSQNFSTLDDIDINKLTEKNTWIHLQSPSDDEVDLITKSFNISEEHIKSALDEEEKARLEIDEDTTLIIIDVPIHETDNKFSFTTVPLGIILLKDNIITVATSKLFLLEEFVHGKIKNLFTFKKTRFVLQLLFRNSTYFLIYLKEIGRISDSIERQIKKNLRNKKNHLKNEELLLFLELEKSLVYFSTSLKSNETVLKRMMRTELIKKYPDDLELLEDVIIETRQAIEMASIYKSILESTRDAFSTIMSNNLNAVMKKLTSITMAFAVPTLISGLWGMNVAGIPFTNSPFGFLFIMVFTIFCGFGILYFLIKKELF